jgi:hypothetical protein
MIAIQERLKSLRPGKRLTHQTLHFVPLVGNSSHLPDYRLFGSDPSSSQNLGEVPEGLEDMRDKMNQGKIVTVTGADHNIHGTQTKAFLQILKMFLAVFANGP